MGLFRMVNVTIDNKPVSIQLGHGESMTVPSGEVWDVTISLSIQDSDAGSYDDVVFLIDGVAVYTGTTGSNTQNNPQPAKMLLNGGQEIQINTGGGSNKGAHISGYVVSE